MGGEAGEWGGRETRMKRWRCLDGRSSGKKHFEGTHVSTMCDQGLYVDGADGGSVERDKYGKY